MKLDKMTQSDLDLIFRQYWIISQSPLSRMIPTPSLAEFKHWLLNNFGFAYRLGIIGFPDTKLRAEIEKGRIEFRIDPNTFPGELSRKQWGIIQRLRNWAKYLNKEA